MILLDGLDEVGDFGDTLLHGNTLRAETLKKIQSFANRRCNEKCPNRIVVTSRLEGYHRGDLPDFREMELSPLRVPDEVEAFAQRWFTAWLQETDAKLDFESATSRAKRDYVSGIMLSINQSDSVRRLSMNPLLLTILCIIYQIGKKLPQRRAELYEIVAKTMIENWRHEQTGHATNIHEKIDAKEVFYILASLAYWLHENKPGGTMSDEEWQKRIHDLLLEAGHEEGELKQLVEHFMRHARLETGLLTERSLGQIGFFHLTLEEYMAAVEIARQDTDSRRDMVEKHWQNPRWQEVTLLTAGDLDQRGNDKQLENFLLHLLHLEGGTPGRNVLLAGRALADVGERAVKRTIARDIREALKFTMQDADPENGKPYKDPHIAVDIRASAADTLDELGYGPDDLYEFIEIHSNDRSNDYALRVSRFLIAKYPVTNTQYERFLKSENFQNKNLWTNFLKYDENGQPINETWDDEPWEWLQRELQDSDNDIENGVLLPIYWRDPRFGSNRRFVPVVGISWYEANAYCKWLLENWDTLDEGKSGVEKPQGIRLPIENEWALAAGGEENNRFAFGELKNPKEEIMQYANTSESGINRTTPVWMYPQGASPNGVMDMSGNVWEWQANYRDKDHDRLSLRGGSWDYGEDLARVAISNNGYPDSQWNLIGLRVVLLSPSV